MLVKKKCEIKAVPVIHGKISRHIKEFAILHTAISEYLQEGLNNVKHREGYVQDVHHSIKLLRCLVVMSCKNYCVYNDDQCEYVIYEFTWANVKAQPCTEVIYERQLRFLSNPAEQSDFLGGYLCRNDHSLYFSPACPDLFLLLREFLCLVLIIIN